MKGNNQYFSGQSGKNPRKKSLELFFLMYILWGVSRESILFLFMIYIKLLIIISIWIVNSIAY
jgi:hypothetical protein